MDKIAYICVNFIRAEATKECILSLKKYCPFIKIYVADQDDPNDDMKKFYEENNVEYYYLPHDIGLSYCRNFLIEKIKEPYLIWGDNDFIFTEDNGILDALNLLKNNKKIGFVGGSVYGIKNKTTTMLHYERYLYYDKERKLLIYVPLELIEPEYCYIDNHKYCYCDLTFNYVLAKTNIIKNNKKLRWNEKLKVSFEHTDIFLKIKLYSKYKVVYFPDMKVIHNHTTNNEYCKYRHRKDCGKIFGESWGLSVAIGVDGNKLIFNSMTRSKMPKITEPFINKTFTEIKSNKNDSNDKILDYLITNNISFCLLKDTCGYAIINHFIPNNIKLEIGVKDEETKKLILNAFPNTIDIELYPLDKTKNIILNNNMNILVPFPVTKYLCNYTKLDWKSIINKYLL